MHFWQKWLKHQCNSPVCNSLWQAVIWERTPQNNNWSYLWCGRGFTSIVQPLSLGVAMFTVPLNRKILDNRITSDNRDHGHLISRKEMFLKRFRVVLMYGGKTFDNNFTRWFHSLGWNELTIDIGVKWLFEDWSINVICAHLRLELYIVNNSHKFHGNPWQINYDTHHRKNGSVQLNSCTVDFCKFMANYCL